MCAAGLDQVTNKIDVDTEKDFPFFIEHLDKWLANNNTSDVQHLFSNPLKLMLK